MRESVQTRKLRPESFKVDRQYSIRTSSASQSSAVNNAPDAAALPDYLGAQIVRLYRAQSSTAIRTHSVGFDRSQLLAALIVLLAA